MKNYKIYNTVTGKIIITKTNDNREYTKIGLVKQLRENFVSDKDVQDILNELKVSDKVIF